MRPLWERTVTWGVANHLRRAGLSDAQSYAAAALIVRDLDRRNNLAAEMARYPLASPDDVDDPEKTSPRLLQVLDGFWLRVGATSVWTERNRLLMIASSELLRAPPAEIAAARTLAVEASSVEAVKGQLGREGSFGPGWSGLSGLREDVAAHPVLSSFVGDYDAVMDDERKRLVAVKAWQGWAKDRGAYSGRIDGSWGRLSEAAFVSFAPGAYGRATTFADVTSIAALGAGSPRFRDTASGRDLALVVNLVTGGVRDWWIASTPADRYAAQVPAPPRTEPQRVEVVLPPDPGHVTVTPVPGEPARVEITLPLPMQEGEQVAIKEVGPASAGWRPTTTQIVGGALALVGVVVVGLIVRASGRKGASREEGRGALLKGSPARSWRP